MLDIESSALIDLLVNERASVHPQLREQLHDVVEEVERSGKPLMEVIENYGLFTKQEMLQMMADNLGSYVWTPKNSPDIEESVIKMVENNTARSYGVIPIRYEDGQLDLAMRSPLDYQTAETLRFVVNANILPVPVDPDQFDEELERYYPEKIDSVADIIAELTPAELEAVDEDEDHANDAPIVKFVDVVIQQAIKDKASDIHFEPFEKTSGFVTGWTARSMRCRRRRRVWRCR